MENGKLGAPKSGGGSQSGSQFQSGIVESVLSWAKFEAQNDLAKTSGKKNQKIKEVPKLEDANDAGTRNAHLCTLILTKADSLAVSGLGVVGRDRYGVFTLRGKLLNVREATHKQILENAEINNLIKIIGLQYTKKYLTIDDLKSLRYGKVMIMTDRDQDGSHIKGLLINFIHTYWPELLRLPFLEEFITPIVKATKQNEELSFYSLPEFEEWKNSTPTNHTYNIKYYKGLDTLTSKEAIEYFQNMEKHRILFKYEGSQDDDNIVMAFAKNAVNQRKDWLTKHMEETKRRKLLGLPERYLYTKGTKNVSYMDFINLELVHFFNAKNVHGLPCLVDGFKPEQRKIMHTCFKRNDKREVTVAQLASSVVAMSAYYDGEVSLCRTIVNLAQNFVGSNNINLLQPRGLFGTRFIGGKDSASPHCISTLLSPLTRLIFHPHDDPLLNYEVDDTNKKIEPTWYIPVIPMVLVNGAEGIGTGWPTKIPNHNPRDIIKNLRRMISKEEPMPMDPWYKNFKGSIEYISKHRYICNGIVSIIGDNKIEITELPVGTWTETYKENILEPLLRGSDKVKSIISNYKEYHTDTTVRFVVTFSPGEFDRLQQEEGGFHRIFKLTSSLSTAQMHAFDHANCLRRFDTATEVLKEFFTLRLEYYGKRKNYLEDQLQARVDSLTEQIRSAELCDRTVIVDNKTRQILIDELIRHGQPDPVKEWEKKIKIEEEEAAEDEKEELDRDKALQILSELKKSNPLSEMGHLLSYNKNELLVKRDKKLAKLNALKAKTPEMIWLHDLDELEKKLNEVVEKECCEELDSIEMEAKLRTFGKRTTSLGDKNFFPSPNGRLVEFKMTQEIIKKFEKASALSRKEKPIKKEKAEKGNQNEVDEFDALIEGGSENTAKAAATKFKPKKESTEKKPCAKKRDEMKQTSKKKPKGPNKKKNIDTEMETILPPRERSGCRAASKKTNYAALLGDDDEDGINDSEDDPEFFDNSKLIRDDVVGKLSDSEYHSDKSSSDNLIEEDSPVIKKKRARQLGSTASKPTGAKRPRKKGSTSDSDETPKKRRTKGRRCR